MDDTGTITTTVFIFSIVVLFLVGLSGWQGAKWRPIAPALSTQIGILGTFTGIAIALLGAGDSSDGRIIAIENLISGLRVSVWSSIVGFISFILLKIIYQFSKPDEETQISIDPTARIVKKLGEIGQDISNAVGRLDNRTELHHQESRKEAASIENAMQRIINTLEGALSTPWRTSRAWWLGRCGSFKPAALKSAQGSKRRSTNSRKPWRNRSSAS